MMTDKEKMLAGELYDAGCDQLVSDRARAQNLCRQYNAAPDRYILSELLGSCSRELTIEPDFKCDYGYNIFVGDHFYANYDLTILDVCEVRIGNNCLIAPQVGIFTATHPLSRKARQKHLELGQPVSIGDDCWIGARAIINPGVTLGDNVIVASGAVVTKSFGDNVVLAGVPAKVIRELDPDG